MQIKYQESTIYIELYKKYIYFRMVEQSKYMYDYFVIGGGSGGLSSAKEAAALGARVGLADYVRPTPSGTKWGLGGTCVNVGCIPKKMMHFAGHMYEAIDDYEHIGYPHQIQKGHNWEKMVEKVQLYIKVYNL
jgi:pyruvate/2-oxoglutarate dehydrogenase complex dihydrolipoamide dehydrogenase (E3) component